MWDMPYFLLPTRGDLILPCTPAPSILSAPWSPKSIAVYARLGSLYVQTLYTIFSWDWYLLEVILTGPNWLLWRWCTHAPTKYRGLLYLRPLRFTLWPRITLRLALTSSPPKISGKKASLGAFFIESFQIQKGFSFPFIRANDLRSSLLNIRARSFLLSCT